MTDLGAAAGLDRLLGRVTMYRLVTLALTAIAIGALGLSAAGRLAFGPAALLASAGALAAATFLSGRLFARMFDAGQHGESAVITALILLLILPPGLTAADLGRLVLAGVVASGSKYLLAFRGRHLFNPAAFAAVYLGLFGLAHPTWWVATPLLLPVVAIAGAAVLYRIRALPLAGIFLAVSLPIVTVRALGSGLTLGAALWQSVASWPLVFFAAFMLSEPLTLPPRRAQQWAVAAGVGVLVTLPVSLGTIAMSPEIALLVGNLASFLIARRVGIDLVVTGRRALAASSLELTFAPSRRLAFAPGQYVELTLPHAGADSRGTRRVFSIASPPAPDGSIRVGLRVPEDASSFKRALATLPTGSAVSATMVAGDFTLPADTTEPLVLVAGGIGITPFVGQLAQRPRRDTVLVYAPGDDPAYLGELATTGVPVVLVSRHPPVAVPAHWTVVRGSRVTDEILRGTVPELDRRSGYVSGPPTMVREVARMLRGAGVSRVRTDAFSGY
jgi:ferredoxin-NADP reductase